MAIRGLTDGTTLGTGLPKIATLYKGGEKREREKNGRKYEIMGEDLDHFRVEFEPAFEYLRPAWEERYGNEVTQLEPVYLMAPTVDEAFQSWKEEWNTSQTLIHRCDGEYQVQWYHPDFHMQMKAKIPCVSPANEQGIIVEPQCACKSTGRLNLLLPEFIDLTGVLGYITVTTHSINDILTLYRYLADIERLQALRNHTLVNVPFVFGRAPKEISAPKTGKGGVREGRIKTKKSLFFLYVLPEFTQQQLLPLFAAALPTQTAPALPKPAVDVEKAKRQLGSGKSSARRVGTERPALPNGETQKHWANDLERFSAFTQWAKNRFDVDADYIWIAFENAVDYPVDGAADWQGDEVEAMAAVVAFACEYDMARIEKATTSGFTEAVGIRVYDLAIAIAERMNADDEPVGEAG